MKKLLSAFFRSALLITIVIFLFGVSSVISHAQADTLGNTTVGTSTDNGDSNEMNGSKFTMGANNGVVTSMSVYVANVNATPNNKYQLGIYSDAAGRPGTLITQSGTGTLTANAWNTVAISTSLTANTKYWLMYNSNGLNGSSNNMKYSSGGAGGWANAFINFGTWPSNFGPATVDTTKFSIYATYSTNAPTPTITFTPTPTLTPTAGPSPTPAPTSFLTPTPTPTSIPTPTPTPIDTTPPIVSITTPTDG